MAELGKRLARISKSIETLSPGQAVELYGHDGVLFVDLRDGYELMQYGMIPGAEHCPRGSLEFRIPKDSKWHRPVFAEDQRFIFYCSHGERSILALETVMQLGLKNACHIGGGMTAWIDAGGPIMRAPARG